MQNPANFTLAEKFAATHPRHVSLILTNKSARESSHVIAKQLQATASDCALRYRSRVTLVRAGHRHDGERARRGASLEIAQRARYSANILQFIARSSLTEHMWLQYFSRTSASPRYRSSPIGTTEQFRSFPFRFSSAGRIYL